MMRKKIKIHFKLFQDVQVFISVLQEPVLNENSEYDERHASFFFIALVFLAN